VLTSQIKQLPKQLINKIAAGEVVERPLSVVKELTENAIDAGATAVTVEIKDGGLSLIKVTDNGSGIPPDQIMLAFLQHATSKITDIDDLAKIASLGFRGEALASISSVSHIEMLTKTAESLSGTRVELHGGTLVSRQEIGASEGTSISVSNLFFNTPARLKFLKKPTTEASYVTDLMQRLALAYPHLAVRYINNGQTIIATNGNGDLKTAIYHIYGKDAAQGILSIESEGVSGYIGKPEIARGSRSAENFFVNGRYIKCSLLQNAVEEAYRGRLPIGRFPFCVLHLQIPPDQVDVNVHPAKMELRFADEREIYTRVTEAIGAVLSANAAVPSVVRPTVQKSKPKPEPKQEEIEYIPAPALAERTIETPAKDHDFSLISQIWGCYWLALRGDELFLIDQHAAHERVLYERQLSRLKNSTNPSQPLLEPQEIALSPKEIAIALEYKNWLEDFGFALDISDKILISALPEILKNTIDSTFFAELLGKLEKGGEESPVSQIIEELAMMACKAAIKANDSISTAEARSLVNQMLALDDPYHCPHGRPTMIKLTRREIERMFKRT